MNRNLAMASMILAVLTLAALAVAQDQSAPSENTRQHHRYKLVDLGTFDGPLSYIPKGAEITAVRFLNSKGMLAGWADTSSSDPFPDFCLDEDCLVAHAFLGKKSGKKDLGVLPGA